MKIALTGANGGIGHFIVSELLNAGHEVIGVYNKNNSNNSGIKERQADLTDLGQTFFALKGCDAVVHFAAVPRAGLQADNVVFQTNTISTFNVFEAASELEIKRVVCASSTSIYGFCFAEALFSPTYLPVNEVHPLLHQDCYGLSKLVGEEIGAAFTRKTGSDSIFLRLPWCILPESYDNEFKELQRKEQEFTGRHLWAYCDVRDVAQAVRLSVEYPKPLGHEVFLITADDHCYAPTPVLSLIRSKFPGIPVDEQLLKDDSTAFDISKAKKILGYQPKHSWRSYVRV